MPCPELRTLTKQETKTILISRFRMLECGVNFKGSKNVVCQTCKKTDDENHRLNHCIRFKTTNCFDDAIKPKFEDVYSSDINVLRRIATIIEKIWNTRNAHGSMLWAQVSNQRKDNDILLHLISQWTPSRPHPMPLSCFVLIFFWMILDIGFVFLN